MKIAIAGATGLTGNLCLKNCLRSSQVTEVIVYGRRKTGITHPKLKEVALENQSTINCRPVDVFICCLGTTLKKAGSQTAFQEIDRDLPLAISKSLRECGCNAAIIVSALGANPLSRFLYLRTKGELEDSIRMVGFRSLHFFRPSFLIGKRKDTRFSELLLIFLGKLLSPLLFGRLSRLKPVPVGILASAIVQSALHSSAGMQIHYYNDIKNLTDGRKYF